MKYFLSICLLHFLLFSNTSLSQDYIETIAIKSCECLDKLSNTKNGDEFNTQFGDCMIKAAEPYKEQLFADYRIDISKGDEHAEVFGRMIGTKMVSICPTKLMDVANKLENTEEPEVDSIPTITGNNNKVSGTVSAIKGEVYIALLVKNNNTGENIKYYWFTKVASNIDMTTSYKSLIGKEVEIEYEIQKIFDARIEEYRNVKVITSLYTL